MTSMFKILLCLKQSPGTDTRSPQRDLQGSTGHVWEEEHVGRALALPGSKRKNKAPGNLRLTRDAMESWA